MSAMPILAGPNRSPTSPYGYIVTYEKAFGFRTVLATCVHKGPYEYSARQAAKFKKDFVRIKSIAPLTEAEWKKRQ